MRTLYYVPMRHPQEELGTIIGPFQRLERFCRGQTPFKFCRGQTPFKSCMQFFWRGSDP